MINSRFYDIESLENAFTVAVYDHPNNRLELFVLLDQNSNLDKSPDFIEKLTKRIYEKNTNLLDENGNPAQVVYFDLRRKEDNIYLANEFGFSTIKWANNPSAVLREIDDLKRNSLSSGTVCQKGIATNIKINDPKTIKHFVCDTDPEYDASKHYYLMGYNSYNYDTTMLALYFKNTIKPDINLTKVEKKPIKNSDEQIEIYTEGEVVISFSPTTPAYMRSHNNNLFESRYKGSMPSYLTSNDSNEYDGFNNVSNIVRRNMILSGRHIDVARLNEKQRKVGLKRLLGMLGYQILESDKLSSGQDTIETEDQLIDLLAYNVSDVVNLKELFYHPMYQAQFELKKGLLDEYPELIYEQKPNSYEPNISPYKVRKDRLCIDASSAQFATKCLCPYGHLTDIPTVSFEYPHPMMCKDGEKPRNILTECIEFLNNIYPKKDPKFAHIWKAFDNVIKFYRSIEGKNFNDTDAYQDERVSVYLKDHAKYRTLYPDTAFPLPTDAMSRQMIEYDRPFSQEYRAFKLKNIPKLPTCIPYFDKEGKETSAFALFSTGGIHGAEYNKELYEYDLSVYNATITDLEEAKAQFNGNPVACRKAKVVTMSDGRELPYTTFLKSGRKIEASEWKDLSDKKPQLFRKAKKSGDDSTNLNPKYTFTSASICNHEDFTSYYPNLLRQMRAFFNPGIGKDRYGDIFYQKQDYGKKMKDKSRPEEERNHYRILREGTKLILNSASGAGDATFDNNIRVNNLIISMRIIGQLFSWHIGQAQSYAGATIISTNTDGLYSVMEEEQNNKILEKESAGIGVEIEPEPLYLISKDSNNRMELDKTGIRISAASGGTLACRLGPDPGKALAHPAIIDWALAEYLAIASQNYKETGLDKPFDETIGLNILKSAITKFAPDHYLRMFQNLIASSPGTYTFVCGFRDGEEDKERIVLQHYNRVFIVKDGTEGAIHLEAAIARVVTPAMKTKRSRDGDKATIQEYIPSQVMKANGVNLDSPEVAGKDITLRKVTNVEKEWYMLICNESLKHMSEDRIYQIADKLDLEKYLILLKQTFERNWMNHLPSNGDFDYNPEENDNEESDEMVD